MVGTVREEVAWLTQSGRRWHGCHSQGGGGMVDSQGGGGMADSQGGGGMVDTGRRWHGCHSQGGGGMVVTVREEVTWLTVRKEVAWLSQSGRRWHGCHSQGGGGMVDSQGGGGMVAKDRRSAAQPVCKVTGTGGQEGGRQGGGW